MTILLDARLAARGLGMASFVKRLMSGFSMLGGEIPDLWGASTTPGQPTSLRTLSHSGLFDLSPRLDPRCRGYDVFHFACNLGSLVPGRNSVLTVHDLLHRRRLRGRDRVQGELLERALIRAGRVVAISARTAAAVTAAFPQLQGRVDVIPHGLRRLPEHQGPREHLMAFGGSADPRKRVDLLIAVYRRYQSTVADPLPLVVAARAGLTGPQRLALEDLRARIVWQASGGEVDALLAGAAALLFPSAEEGFGLPVLEAAEWGTPVVLDGRAKVADEVLGQHCIRVEGADIGAWVRGLQKAVEMEAVPQALPLPGWDEVAASYRALYEELT